MNGYLKHFDARTPGNTKVLLVVHAPGSEGVAINALLDGIQLSVDLDVDSADELARTLADAVEVCRAAAEKASS